MTYVDYNYSSLHNVAKYVTGAAINNTDIGLADGIMGYGGLMAATKVFQGGKWVVKNRKDYKAAINVAKTNFANQAALERSLKGKNFYETMKNFNAHQKTTAQQAVAAAGTGKLAKVTKFAGSNKGFFAISMLAQSGTVYDAYKLSADHGNKQLVKSAINVGAETLGYAAGAKLGASLGATIGTAICPGLGTAIGGVVGVLVGLACSWGAGQLTRTYITGKDEAEIVKEDKARRLALNAKYNSATAEKLLIKTRTKLESEEAAQNPDSGNALSSYNKLATQYAQANPDKVTAEPQTEGSTSQQSEIDKKIEDFKNRINGSGSSYGYGMSPYNTGYGAA